MPRVVTADKCLDRHELEVGGEWRVYFCQRARGHAGVHSSGGSIQWERRLPPPGRGGAPRPAA